MRVRATVVSREIDRASRNGRVSGPTRNRPNVKIRNLSIAARFCTYTRATRLCATTTPRSHPEHSPEAHTPRMRLQAEPLGKGDGFWFCEPEFDPDGAAALRISLRN
jgi:hypothetical protein